MGVMWRVKWYMGRRMSQAERIGKEGVEGQREKKKGSKGWESEEGELLYIRGSP